MYTYMRPNKCTAASSVCFHRESSVGCLCVVSVCVCVCDPTVSWNLPAIGSVYIAAGSSHPDRVFTVWVTLAVLSLPLSLPPWRFSVSVTMQQFKTLKCSTSSINNCNLEVIQAPFKRPRTFKCVTCGAVFKWKAWNWLEKLRFDSGSDFQLVWPLLLLKRRRCPALYRDRDPLNVCVCVCLSFCILIQCLGFGHFPVFRCFLISSFRSQKSILVQI